MNQETSLQLPEEDQKTKDKKNMEDYKRWADAAGHHSKLGKFYFDKYLELAQKLGFIDSKINQVDSNVKPDQAGLRDGSAIDRPFKDTVLVIEDQMGLIYNKIHESGKLPLYVDFHGNIYLFKLTGEEHNGLWLMGVEMAKPRNPEHSEIEQVVADALNIFNRSE